MPQQTVVDLRFPSAGLDRRYAARQQPPFSSPSLQNVRADSTVKGRERGGSRPGLSKSHYTQLGSGNPVRLLEGVRVIRTDGMVFWDDSFFGSALGGVWSTASWIGTIPSVMEDDYAGITFANAAGAVRTALTGISTASDYFIGIFLVPFKGSFGGDYQIFLRMDNAAPDGSMNGVEVKLTATSGTGSNSGSLISRVAGVPTVLAALSDAALGLDKPGWLVAKISGNTITVFWQGVNIGSGVAAAPVGARVGFGLNCTVAGGACMIANFRADYKQTGNPQVSRNLLVASSNGVLYRETSIGTFEVVASSLTLNTDRLIQGADRGQKLYIADNGNPKVTGTDGFNGTGVDRFDATGVPDWTVLGISTFDDVLVITNATGFVINGVYRITAVAAGEITTSPNCNTGAGTGSYRVERGPKIYDPAANTLTLWMTTPGKGHVPVGCPLIARYRDRLTLGGAPANPTLWNMSRQGDPLDFDTGADASDVGRAVAGNVSDAGLVGEPLTSIMTYSDDYLLFGAESSLWCLRGDPATGGSIDALSRSIGDVSGRSWCVGPAGEIYFLSRDGIYSVPPGGNQVPSPVSRQKLPRELIDLDPSTMIVTMAYSVRHRGVFIFVTSIDKATTFHWWFDLETGGFFLDSFGNVNHEPTVIYQYNAPVSVDSAVLMGSRDGYIRRHRDSAETDDGTTITSFVLYGPMRLGGSDYNDGQLVELIGVLGRSSGNITFEILVADTHEQLPNVTATLSGTFSELRNYNAYPRRRGGSWALKLKNAQTNRAWFVESMTAKVNRYKKHRIFA